jgi:S-adenosylmethionine:tRNA ribosyltransferase-isomerase
MTRGDFDADFLLSDYDYQLPKELVAQEPMEPRDAARMLTLDRATGTIDHRQVRELPGTLRPGDLIVVNRSRVLRSRLLGTKADTGGRVELTLVRPVATDTWEALLRGRVRTGQQIHVADEAGEVGERTPGARLISFPGVDVYALMARAGRAPLPPYIRGYQGDGERYQTVYADALGSAAAPTAGLHFTPELITLLRQSGIRWTSITLHIGLDTFRPITDEDVRQRHIHTEWIEVPEEVVTAVSETRQRGGRVLAVGTSTVRSLEFASRSGSLQAYQGPTDLFIVPGYGFRIVDALLTNFHMPRTSVLLLVAAFAGRQQVLQAYQQAIVRRYRFLSFGDTMLVL